MKVLVTTFSYERPNLLRLTMSWLLESRYPGFYLAIFDDDSGSETQDVLFDFQDMGVITRVPGVLNHTPRSNYHVRAQRCAVLRRAVVDFFLEKDCFDYLVFKDDDVLTTCKAIQEAIEDFEFLKKTDWAKIGALTLHGICSHKGYLTVDGRVFAELDITGEANVIFSKEALLAAGNHFGPVKGGFADTQFGALREAGFRYYDRVWPTYEVQHLGIGPNSSTIHQQERVPSWNVKPYECTYKRRDFGRELQVPGFDLNFFKHTAMKEGAEEAARLYPAR